MSDDILNLAAVADELEQYIQQIIPDSVPVKKYGGVLFTLRPEEKEGQFCGVFIYKEHVQISFSRGAELDDPGKLLKGSGKQRRHVNFTCAGDIDFTALEKLLTKASMI